MKNLPWKRISTCSLAGLLAACLVENGKTAGGATDVPNYLAALGPLAMGSIQASSDWGRARNGVYDTLSGQVPLGPPRTGVPAVAKRGAGSEASAPSLDSIRWDYSDSARGLATAYRHAVSGAWENRDTSLVRYDEHAKAGDYAGAYFLRTRGTGRFNFLASVTHGYVGEDSDSDGVLDRRTNIVTLQWWGNPEQETWHTTDHPGADLDFQTGGDNPVERSEKVVTLGPDTLLHEYLEDRDGDGSIWTLPLSGIDSSRFLYFRAAPGLAGSAVKRGEVQALVTLYDSSIQRPMEISRARFRNHFHTGAVHTLGMHGFRADSTYLAGDSLEIVLAQASPAPDSVASRELAFRVQTSLRPGSPDALVHARVEAVLRQGPIAEARLLFLPDAPLAAGAAVGGGAVSLSARLASGSAIGLEGRYEGGRLSAEITEADGTTYRAAWDGNGNLLQDP